MKEKAKEMLIGKCGEAGEYDCCYAMCLIILTDFQLTDLLKDSHYLI